MYVRDSKAIFSHPAAILKSLPSPRTGRSYLLHVPGKK